ncbi:TlpA family protein disulfide reductase [Clostridium tagluense]|uniref:TlpA family protein disulfide reductase n=1 Tax=Clostridium tagluense TaxID=360422 RepID=UPI001C6EABA2|nr:TlpA disulfide reductase family protein [Clostridium tagluense]MBW9155637.1 TlpA family protein disulfide reductase [Clostridium tagluense]WLC65240.1 TlpA family protein disulfide reductase [Clostridium tagluense]
MNKKNISIALVLSLIVISSAVFVTVKNKQPVTKKPVVLQNKVVQPILTPQQERRKQGYIKKNSLGVEYKINAVLWTKYDDNISVDGIPDADDEDNTKPVYGGRKVSYISVDLMKQYEQALKIQDKKEKKAKTSEILSKGKDFYSIVVYRKDKLPSEVQIKKDVKCENQQKLGEKENFVFYFGYNNFNDKDLPAEEKVIYKELYDDAMAIKSTITTFKPLTLADAFKETNNLKFKLKDLDGNEVSSEIFNKNKLTMVNLWATYCGYCIDEMPILQSLNQELANDKFGILGVVGDVYAKDAVDKTLLEKAKKIVAEKGVLFTNVIPDDVMKYDGPLGYISGYPTSFFVDSKGNIVGDIIVGDKTKAEYKQIIEKLLKEVK